MNDLVVELLRKLLALAEQGEVIAIAVATIAPDLSTGSAYRIGDATIAELVGSIELLKHRVMCKCCFATNPLSESKCRGCGSEKQN